MPEERSVRKREKAEDRKDWRFSLEIFQAVLCLIIILLVFLFCKLTSNGKALMTEAFDYLDSVSIEQSEIEKTKDAVSAFFSFGDNAQN